MIPPYSSVSIYSISYIYIRSPHLPSIQVCSPPIQGKVHAVVEHPVASELHLGQDPPENQRAGPTGPMGHTGYGPSDTLDAVMQ